MVTNNITDLLKKYHQAMDELAEIECQLKGLPEGKPPAVVFRGSYLILVYCEQGQRRENYIGNDPVKIHQALQLVHSLENKKLLETRKRKVEDCLKKLGWKLYLLEKQVTFELGYKKN